MVQLNIKYIIWEKCDVYIIIFMLFSLSSVYVGQEIYQWLQTCEVTSECRDKGGLYLIIYKILKTVLVILLLQMCLPCAHDYNSPVLV